MSCGDIYRIIILRLLGWETMGWHPSYRLLVNSAADAALVTRACCYAPRGDRSFGPVLAALRAGGGVHGGGPAAEVLVMIETAAGLADVEAIAAVDGVTGLYVGPNDLALSMGLGAGSDRREPEMIAAFRRIVAAARGAGKGRGCFALRWGM